MSDPLNDQRLLFRHWAEKQGAEEIREFVWRKGSGTTNLCNEKWLYKGPRLGKCVTCQKPLHAEWAMTINFGVRILGDQYSMCWRCGNPVKTQPVRGKYSAKKICNARCLASTGPNCECSCAGANHGKNYSSDSEDR